jgi:hypothetical protein
MSAGTLYFSGHSADVRMTLRLNGRALPISHLGPDFVIVTTPIDHPPAEAEIVLVIDGHEDCWPVCLHQGMSVAQGRTSISRYQPVNGSTV